MSETSRIDRVVGGEIRAARARKRWSQAKLAEESGVPFGSLRRYEAGESPVNVSQLERISASLGIRFADMLDAIARASEQDDSAED